MHICCMFWISKLTDDSTKLLNIPSQENVPIDMHTEGFRLSGSTCEVKVKDTLWKGRKAIETVPHTLWGNVSEC